MCLCQSVSKLCQERRGGAYSYYAISTTDSVKPIILSNLCCNVDCLRLTCDCILKAYKTQKDVSISFVSTRYQSIKGANKLTSRHSILNVEIAIHKSGIIRTRRTYIFIQILRAIVGPCYCFCCLEVNHPQSVARTVQTYLDGGQPVCRIHPNRW